MEALIAGGGTLLVVFGYMLVKKISRSRCAVDSGCITCESPAVELQKKTTERLDDLFEMVKRLEPDQEILEHLSADRLEDNVVTTTSKRKECDNSVAYSDNFRPALYENRIPEVD